MINIRVRSGVILGFFITSVIVVSCTHRVVNRENVGGNGGSDRGESNNGTNMAIGSNLESRPPGINSELPPRSSQNWRAVKGKKFTPVYFSYDQSRIGTDEVAKLEGIANYMGRHRNVGLVIEGHCDERGNREYNVGLGERRALAVRAYLTRLGVADVRIQTVSYGSERPENMGHDEMSWSKNRRAELIPEIIGL